MPVLGTLLDVEGTRLTGVDLTAPKSEPRAGWNTAAVLRIDLTDLHESRAVAGALLPFLPSACAIVSGVDDAGTGWVAPILVAGSALTHDEVEAAAGGELARAVTLLGIDNARATMNLVQLPPLSTDELVQIYQDDCHPIRTLRDWTVVDLVFGLILELITHDLDVVVEEFFAQGGSGRHAQRREVLCSHLDRWSQQQGQG